MTVSSIALLIGIGMIVLASFGIQLGPMNLFEFGVGVAFSAGLVKS